MLRRQPLAGGDGDRRCPRDTGHLLGTLGRDGLLQPERVVLLEATGEPDRARRRELTVRADEKVGPVADRLADEPHVALGALERLERRLPRVESRVGAEWIELDRREALGHVLRSPSRGGLGIVVDVSRVPVRGVEIRVGAEPLAHSAAEERMDRTIELLPDDVPARHLDPAQNADQGDIRSLGVAPRVDLAPQLLDPAGVGSDHVALADVLDHPRDRVSPERRRVDLPDALDPGVGGQLDEHEIPPPVRGRRIRDHERLRVDDLHQYAIQPPSTSRFVPLT